MVECNENSTYPEAGYSSLSGWRRDSARPLPLRKAGPSIPSLGGTCPLVDFRIGSHGGRRRTVDSHKEDSMTLIIVLATSMGVLSYLMSVVRFRTAVALRRRAGESRPCVK